MSSIGLQSQIYCSPNDFLSANLRNKITALITDMRMPYKSGLELADEIRQQKWKLPIVFITAYAEVSAIVQAMKAGAIDVLEKPFREHEIINAANKCLSVSRQLNKRRGEQQEIIRRADYLTNREFEVFKLLIEGKMNKVIAADLKLSTRTIEQHRGNVMKKMEVTSLPDLVYCAQKLKDASNGIII